MSGERLITLAAVIGAHGVAGEVRLRLFAEDAAALALYPGLILAGRPAELRSIRPGPNGSVARFAGIDDRNAAEALRGAELCVPRSALPPLGEGEYYHVDLIGLPCVAGDRAVGVAIGIENFGAGDVIEIERPDGGRFMAPVAAAVTIAPDRLLIDPDFVDDA